MSAAQPLRFGATASRAARPPTERTPILGAMTGRSQDVDEAIEAAAISARMRKLLHKAKREAFRTAGFQQVSRHAFMRAEPGAWCECHTAEWARELGAMAPKISKTYLCELRAQAESLGFFTYHPNPEMGPGQPDGFIRWNLNLDEWAALDAEYRRARYARPGAGSKTKATPTDSKVKRTPASPAIPDDSKVKQGDSKVKRAPFKSETVASYEAGNDAAPLGALRMDGEEYKETTPATARAHAGEGSAAQDAAEQGMDRPITTLAKLHPDDREAAWVIIDQLQAIPDWPGRRTGKLNPQKAADLVIKLLSKRGIPLEWMDHQASLYAAWEGKDEDRPPRHDQKGFEQWCTSEKAMRDLQRWLADPWPLRVSPTTAAAAASAAPRNRQGANHNGDTRRSARGTARTEQRAGVSNRSRAQMVGYGAGESLEFT